MANNFLPFCPTDTGTNLVSQAAYAVDADRVSGNKPGIASSALNNKALRQASFVASQVAELIAAVQGVDVLDDGNTARLLQQMIATFIPLNYFRTTYSTAGTSGNHDLKYIFFCATASATSGATYTNNGITFTVFQTLAAGTVLICSANGAPTVSGTLTKATGSGDATIAFYAYRKPAYLEVQVSGGGGGGSGSASAGVGGTGGNGGNSSFGTTIFVGNGGNGGPWAVSGGTGGTASVGAAGGAARSGGNGMGPLGVTAPSSGGAGGCGLISQPGQPIAAGGASATGNPGGAGCGGGGASGYTVTGTFPGTGGGAGGWVDGYLYTPTGTYAYAVGAAGIAGIAGTDGAAGGVGGGGFIIVTEYFQ